MKTKVFLHFFIGFVAVLFLMETPLWGNSSNPSDPALELLRDQQHEQAAESLELQKHLAHEQSQTIFPMLMFRKRRAALNIPIAACRVVIEESSPGPYSYDSYHACRLDLPNTAKVKSVTAYGIDSDNQLYFWDREKSKSVVKIGITDISDLGSYDTPCGVTLKAGEDNKTGECDVYWGSMPPKSDENAYFLNVANFLRVDSRRADPAGAVVPADRVAQTMQRLGLSIAAMVRVDYEYFVPAD